MDDGYWPLDGLRLTTPRLELRLPDQTELRVMADLAAGGIHPPESMPFTVNWTDLDPVARGRSVLQHHWRRLGDWTPQRWELNLSVFVDGVPVGLQSLSATDFAARREVETGSWLGLAHQGRGIGTEMRAAVLHLAFLGLDALDATSGAFHDNPASLRVSEKLGYRPDGISRLTRRGVVGESLRLRLPRTAWCPQVPVTVHGLDRCRDMFG